MKRILVGLSAMLLVLGVVGVAGAIPIDFKIANSSNVSVSGNGDGWIQATLASGLAGQVFSVADGATKEIDFFDLTVGGLTLGTPYTIGATLAFDSPENIDPVYGSGSGNFFTIFGIISGGTMQWDSSTLPNVFRVSGDSISVDFESGIAFGIGDTATVHAYITNDAGTTNYPASPVPEPATMLLVGTGLVGLAALGRSKLRMA